VAVRDVIYSINDTEVTSPDEEVWSPVAIGTALTGRQKRSPYWRLEWHKTVAGPCRLDWFDYDNTTLDSLTTRTPGKLDISEIYTDAVCQSVVFRQRRGVGNEIVATFLVYVG